MVNVGKNGCLMYGEQVPDPGFELVGDELFVFTDTRAHTNTRVYQSTDAHSGNHYFQVMFEQEHGGAYLISVPRQNACAERVYRHSFWAKAATDNLCAIRVFWGGIRLGEHHPRGWPNAAWSQFEGTYKVPLTGDLFYGGTLDFNIQCDEGGPKSLVWLDDISFGQPDLFNALPSS